MPNQSFLSGATCSIGRAKYHDVVLNSPLVAEDHAVVHNDAEHGLLVIDLYTENGTFVAGNRLPPLQPLPLRALSDLAIPVYGTSTGEAEMAELVKRVAEVLTTRTDYPNELGRLFVPSHPYAYDPSTPIPPPIMHWNPTPAVPTPTPGPARSPAPEPCPPSEPSPAPPSPHTPPRTTRDFSPLPQRTSRVSGPLPPASRVYRHTSPGRIFNHPSPARNPRVPSPLANLRGSPAAARASPLATPRASPSAVPRPSRFAPRTHRPNEPRQPAYPEIPRDSPFTRENPYGVPVARTQASTPNVPRPPHPQDADTMPTHSPFPRPILKTQSKRSAVDDGSSRPRKRARTAVNEADAVVRGMPGAWPYESGSGSWEMERERGLREESLKERVERERGGRKKVRFGEPGVWAGARA
ncbi:unnamed protein product [Peniophora sp. CBMAI 1063]|nr:unnamed protein product [Peniophora sp. CBMAI 1063]